MFDDRVQCYLDFKDSKLDFRVCAFVKGFRVSSQVVCEATREKSKPGEIYLCTTSVSMGSDYQYLANQRKGSGMKRNQWGRAQCIYQPDAGRERREASRRGEPGVLNFTNWRRGESLRVMDGVELQCDWALMDDMATLTDWCPRLQNYSTHTHTNMHTHLALLHTVLGMNPWHYSKCNLPVAVEHFVSHISLDYPVCILSLRAYFPHFILRCVYLIMMMLFLQGL